MAAVPIIAVIPARIGSTRFPRKALASETGQPLIRHVAESVARCRAVARIVIATDSEEIAAAVRSFGGEAVMTSVEHPNGTSRIDEAAERLGFADEQTIVNVQGDEPEIEPDVIESAVRALLARDARGEEADIGTVAAPLDGADAGSPNIVKVALRLDGSALYFSRAPIPFVRDAGAAPAPMLRHVGVYAYRRAFLREYVRLSPSPLEQAERLEQLRALEHGKRIAVGRIERTGEGIDTPGQYDRFVRRWRAARA